MKKRHVATEMWFYRWLQRIFPNAYTNNKKDSSEFKNLEKASKIIPLEFPRSLSNLLVS